MNRAVAATVAAIFLALLICGVAAASQEKVASETVVLVAGETMAKSDRVTLGNIAQIFSDDEQRKSLLLKIELGYAPDVGAVRQLTLEQIALAIKAAGLTSGTVRVEGPPIAFIKRATQIIEHSYVREAVERAVLRELRATGAAARLVRLDLPHVIEVPAGATEVRASVGGSRDLFSPFIASIEIWADSRILRRLSVNAQAEAFAPVLVATRDLPAGARVREEDVTIEARRLKRAVSFYVRDAKALRGVALKRALPRGEALMSDALIAEIAVKPGDPVRIIGESGLLYVEVKGEARTAGRVGDRIQVKNVQSGVVLQAVIENEGVVRVHF